MIFSQVTVWRIVSSMQKEEAGATVRRLRQCNLDRGGNKRKQTGRHFERRADQTL